MRFLLILSTLVLLPAFVGLHAWQFARRQQPELEAAALAILRKEGIQAAAVELRYLDLRVTGNAPTSEALERTISKLQNLRPTRLVSNELSIPGTLRAELQGQVLRLKGWLGDRGSIDQLAARLAALRPDLRIDATELRASPQVRWPEGVADPLANDGPLLAGILEKLRVAPALRITASGKSLVLTGALPSEQVRDSIIRVLREAAPTHAVDTAAVQITRHISAAEFVEEGALGPFLRSFYGTPDPGDFAIGGNENPSLRAAATPTLEADWLRLLRQVTGGMKVDMQLTLYPSVYHFPGYKPVTPLSVETLENLRRAVSEFYITFEGGSATLSTAAGTRLSGLASTLLSAGPALRLIVGGHPEAQGDVVAQRRLALARAEQVRSYLVEQGAPAAEIQAIAFDAVPAGTPAAPLQPRSVEILIK